MAKKKLITHNGKFHTDDVFACATLCLFLEKKGNKYEIIRTRDEEIVSGGDYVFDVGGIYDPENDKFDHHQQEGAGRRENGLEYASFGLVWKKYGEELCGSKEVAAHLDEKIATPIDAQDNGVDLFTLKYENVFPYAVWDVFSAFLPTWKEDESAVDKIFIEIVDLAKKILEREITREQSKKEAEMLVDKAYSESPDKRLIVLDVYYPWRDVLSKYSEPLFVITPRVGGKWDLMTVQVSKDSFKSRKDLPRAWGGLSGRELEQATGVPDAIFCHRALFIAAASSKEGILKLAELALQN